MQQLANTPKHLRSVQVLVRFGLRLVVLGTFAAFGGIGFGKSLAALLWMSIMLSAVVGVMRRERPFDSILNHWDETVAYGALFENGHHPETIVRTASSSPEPTASSFIWRSGDGDSRSSRGRAGWAARSARCRNRPSSGRKRGAAVCGKMRRRA